MTFHGSVLHDILKFKLTLFISDISGKIFQRANASDEVWVAGLSIFSQEKP